MKRKYLITIGVIALAGVAGVGMYVQRQDTPPTDVEAGSATLQRIQQKVNATGKIQPETQVNISADVSSKILALHVQEGDWVNKGDLLVDLDRERYEAAVESAEASVRSAQANARLVAENRSKSEKEYKRVTQMVERGLESQANLDTAEAAWRVEVARYESAQDQVEQAKGLLKQARDQLAKTTLYAPMSGTISDLNKEAGEIAIGSQFQEDVIMVIADLTAMEARVNVDENDIVAIQIDQSAEIEVDALPGRTLTGTVTDIARSANVAGEGTSDQKTEFEVRIAINPDVAELRPGMTASADIITGTKEEALGVPIQSIALRSVEQLKQEFEAAGEEAAALEPDRDGFVEVVFVIDHGKARAQQVETGLQSDDYIEIVSGLEEGEEIVTGSYRAISKDLKHGAAVAVNAGEDHQS